MVAVVEFGEVVSEEVMVAAFAKDEINSPRYRQDWTEMLHHPSRSRSVVDTPDLLNAEENWMRRAV